jgi:Transglycosylase SLT domain
MTMELGALGSMTRLAAMLLAWALALGCAHANAQAGATPPTPELSEAPQSAEPDASQISLAHPPTTDDICRALEQAAAENALPVEFFARVIWQESRFNASAVSPKGAEGIAQFMPRTADWHGLADPFDPIEALRHSAHYLRELRDRFGNLGLAAAAYNAGPGRVSAWLGSHRPLPGETRNYVATVTGWTADEWASGSPPQRAETTIPQGVPCARLANLILAPKQEAQRIATYIPRWGVQLAAHLSESKAWEIYRERQSRFASLIGDSDPIVLHKEIPGMGRAKRYIITIASDDRVPLDKLCQSLIAVGATCDVLRNSFGQTNVRGARLPEESIARRPTGQDQPERSAGD